MNPVHFPSLISAKNRKQDGKKARRQREAEIRYSIVRSRKKEIHNIIFFRVPRDTTQKRDLLLPGSLPGNSSIHSGSAVQWILVDIPISLLSFLHWLRLGFHLNRHSLSPLTQHPLMCEGLGFLVALSLLSLDSLQSILLLLPLRLAGWRSTILHSSSGNAKLKSVHCWESHPGFASPSVWGDD